MQPLNMKVSTDIKVYMNVQTLARKVSTIQFLLLFIYLFWPLADMTERN